MTSEGRHNTPRQKRPRGWQIMVNLEEDLFELVQRQAVKHGTSASSYTRQCIIADLISRGLIPEELKERMLLK